MGSKYSDTGFPTRVPGTRQPDLVDTFNNLHRYWRSEAVEGYMQRYWPADIDHDAWIDTIRGLLARQLPQFEDAEIKYFAAGTFNRLYSVGNPNWPKTYIFRVSIPVEPFYKTESEVATMEYVRKHSSMPVPRVVAFSSADANELGYEWILMEMLPGVSLRSVWDSMPQAARIQVFTELAELVKGLLSLRFSKFGNIYFADVADQVGALPQTPLATKTNGAVNNIDPDLGPNDTFVMGRLAAQDFFFNKRVHFPGSRGPFHTTRQLIEARMDLLGQRIHNLSTTPGEPYFCGSDEGIARHKDLVYSVFDQFKSLIPHLVPRDNGPEDVGILFHDDLSEHNLLVDPVTYKLTGIVDWEAVSILPAYESYDARPAFLSDRDWRPIPLTLIERGVKPNDEVVAAKIVEREKEFGAIRREYHKIVGPLYDETSAETQRRLRDKRDLMKQLELPSFEHRPWATAIWMDELGMAGDLVAHIAAIDYTNGTEISDESQVQVNGAVAAPRLEMTEVGAA